MKTVEYYKGYACEYDNPFNWTEIPHFYGHKNALMCADLRDAMNNIDRIKLAPTPTCTSNSLVPCPPPSKEMAIKGNNPMYIEEMCVSQSKSLFANSPKKTGADTNVAVVLNAPADTVVSDQRKYLERRVYDLKYEKQDEI